MPASYGATDDQLATITTWAQSQGLTISAISAGKTSMTLTGSADAVQRAFATTLHNYAISGSTRFAPATTPSVPLSVAPMIAAVSGLDNLPPVYAASISTTSVQGRTAPLSTPASDPLATTASAIDANTAPMLTLNLSTCTGDLAQSDVDAYRALFRQANAQGITVLATGGCSSGDTSTSQPSLMLGLPEVTALTVAPDASLDSTLNLTEARPGWQVAPGLPPDQLRRQPDLTTTSAAAFSQTLASIQLSTSGRLGNVNATLYSLATSPGLYTQPDSAAPGTWEPSTGLGVVDLTVLAKVFPRTGTLRHHHLATGQQLRHQLRRLPHPNRQGARPHLHQRQPHRHRHLHRQRPNPGECHHRRLRHRHPQRFQLYQRRRLQHHGELQRRHQLRSERQRTAHHRHHQHRQRHSGRNHRA